MGKRSFLAALYVFFFTTWCGNIFSTNIEKCSSKLSLLTSSTLTVTIIPQDTVDNPPTYCTNVPYHFTGFGTPGPISFWHWYCTPATGVIISDSLQNGTDVTFTKLGTYTLSVIATNINGVTDTATYAINAPGVLQTPVVSPYPPSPTVCNGGSGTTMSVSATPTTSPTSYTWSPQISPALVYLDPNGDSVIINPSSATPPTNFTYTVAGTQNGCVSLPVVITVTVNAPPVPQYTANPNPICSGQQTVLAVNAMPSSTTYTWSQDGGNTGGIGGNSGSFVQATPIYYGAGDTTFVYYVSIDLQGCPPYPPMHVINVLVHPTPFVKVTDTIQDCNKMGDTLKATYIYPPTNVGLVWTTVTGAALTPLASDTNTAFVNPSKSTTSTKPVTYYVTPTAFYYNPTMSCSGVKDSVKLLIGDTTNASIGYLYSIICDGQKDTLIANPANGQLNNSYHYTWSPQASILHTSADGDTVIILPTATTTYTLNVKGICVNKKQAELTVAVNTCNTPPVNFTVNTHTICTTHCITYTDLTLTQGGVKPLFYNWAFPGGVITNAGGGQVYGGDSLYYAAIDSTPLKSIKVCYPLNSLLNNSTTQNGYYPVTETVKNGLGVSVTKKDSVKVYPAPTVNAGTSNITIDLGTSVTLSIPSTGGSNAIIYYNWTSSGDSIANPSSQNPVVTPTTTTEYTLTVIDATGCSNSGSMTVFVDIICKDVFVATAFTPNGDGINDVLHVKSNCGLSNFSFKIFDRWGEKVFESSDPDIGWDGTYRNKPMDTDVFMYTMDGFLSSGVEVKKKGNVTLLR